MNPQQNLRNLINNTAATETTEALQARLDLAGFDIDLTEIPANLVSRVFLSAMTPLLDRPLGDLSVAQIRAITGEVKARSAALETEVSAETILRGFKKLDDGVIELTLPVGTTIQEAGKLLNAAARDRGMEPVFHEGDTYFWRENEANANLQTKPGQTYRFKILIDSFMKTRSEQVRDHGEGAPLGAIAIAEACERLNTINKATLIKDEYSDKVSVRGSTPGVVLYSDRSDGIRVDSDSDNRRYCDVAFASSGSARNPVTP